MGGWRGQLGGKQRAGASDGGQNHQKRSRWAPIFQSGDEIEALVNRSVAVAGRAAPQSISAGGDAQKGPPLQPWPVWSRFNWGRGHGGGRMGEHLHCGQRQIFLGWPEPQQEISAALARAATAYNFGTPAPPPQFHRISFPPVLTLHFRRSSRPFQDRAPTTIATSSTQRYPLSW